MVTRVVRGGAVWTWRCGIDIGKMHLLSETLLEIAVYDCRLTVST